MSDPGESSDLEKAMKEQACHIANKLLEVALNMQGGDSGQKVQIFLVSLSIVLGKFIHGVAASEESREHILEDVIENTRQIFTICDESKRQRQ